MKNRFDLFQPNFIKSLHEKNYVFACDGKTFDLIRLVRLIFFNFKAVIKMPYL
jgi:hypothetical protein